MIYQIKIKLKNVSKPPVWRKVLIDSKMTFDFLHLLIQTAMGWGNVHLYQFSYKPYEGIRIGPENDYSFFDSDPIDSRSAEIEKYLNSDHPKMIYIYDFGDDWHHEITLEKELPAVSGQLPRCIAGKGICPPEDCGGTWEFMNIRNFILENPDLVEKVKNSGFDDYSDSDDFYTDRAVYFLETAVPVQQITDNKIDFSTFDVDAANKSIAACIHSPAQDSAPESSEDDDDTGFEDDEFDPDENELDDMFHRISLSLISQVMAEKGYDLNVDAFIEAEEEIQDALEKLMSDPNTLKQMMEKMDEMEDEEDIVPAKPQKASSPKKSGRKKK